MIDAEQAGSALTLATSVFHGRNVRCHADRRAFVQRTPRLHRRRRREQGTSDSRRRPRDGQCRRAWRRSDDAGDWCVGWEWGGRGWRFQRRGRTVDRDGFRDRRQRGRHRRRRCRRPRQRRRFRRRWRCRWRDLQRRRVGGAEQLDGQWQYGWDWRDGWTRRFQRQPGDLRRRRWPGRVRWRDRDRARAFGCRHPRSHKRDGGRQHHRPGRLRRSRLPLRERAGPVGSAEVSRARAPRL